MYGDKAKQIFNVMIDRGFLPREGSFEVTKDLIDISHDIGNELFSQNGRKQKPSDLRFRKRISGLTLMHLKSERDAVEENFTLKKSRLIHTCGFVYIIKNPNYIGHFKLGITSDVEKRIKSYQTYDPNRSFYVDKKYFVENTRKVENYLISMFSNFDVNNGEWLENKEYKKVVDYLESEMI